MLTVGSVDTPLPLKPVLFILLYGFAILLLTPVPRTSSNVFCGGRKVSFVSGTPSINCGTIRVFCNKSPFLLGRASLNLDVSILSTICVLLLAIALSFLIGINKGAISFFGCAYWPVIFVSQSLITSVLSLCKFKLPWFKI